MREGGAQGLQLFEDVAELTYKRSRRFLSQLIRLSPLGEHFARLQRGSSWLTGQESVQIWQHNLPHALPALAQIMSPISPPKESLFVVQ